MRDKNVAHSSKRHSEIGTIIESNRMFQRTRAAWQKCRMTHFDCNATNIFLTILQH
jgi:hypothetical protein